MHKFPIYNFKNLSELQFEELNAQNFAIYLLDFDWNFLFANTFGCANLKTELKDLTGKNLWATFKQSNSDPEFKKLLTNVEDRKPVNITTVSGFTRQRVNVIGYPLEDCYYFSVSLLPDKENLINELRNQLGKKSH